MDDQAEKQSRQEARQQSRRTALQTLAAAAGGLMLFQARHAEAQRTPQPMPSPNAPSNQNLPTGLDGPEIVHPDHPSRSSVHGVEIRTDVEKLYRAVLELRDEVANTNLSTTMPLGVVKKAHEIEKLAKDIRELSKG